MKAIINGKILLPDGVVSGKALLFDRAVTGLSDTVPADCETIDAQGLYVSPGFVDVHIRRGRLRRQPERPASHGARHPAKRRYILPAHHHDGGLGGADARV